MVKITEELLDFKFGYPIRRHLGYATDFISTAESQFKSGNIEHVVFAINSANSKIQIYRKNQYSHLQKK